MTPNSLTRTRSVRDSSSPIASMPTNWAPGFGRLFQLVLRFAA